MLDEKEEKAENLESTNSNENVEGFSAEGNINSGRDEEKTRALQEALFKDTGGYELNSSVENFQEQMANQMTADMAKEK